jgi:phosphatidylserine/phosphatidylglycerophosphate/cardiolipin synthase-like enzyme/uncharacterized membrane protein YdjX (TVP38/TMEM64 family)
LAVLLDGADYYARLHAAMQKARRSIFILGWDLDSRVELLRGRDVDGPVRLGAFLNDLVAGRDDLEAYVLAWDFASIYALEREPLTYVKMDWRTHRRVHFRFDGTCPFGASHHQKIVVIDDSLAFVGGLDLTSHRWDSPRHAVEDERRTTPTGQSYGPYHDAQTIVTGPVAQSLGGLARERWRRASPLEPVELLIAGPHAPCWPDDLEPDLTDVDVGIARTMPAYGDQPAIREIERLSVDSIARARTSIYVENQYLSSHVVVNALRERVSDSDCPEIFMVLPSSCSGWLEETCIGGARDVALQNIREADRSGRFRVVYPIASAKRGTEVFVHAKVMIVDDELLRIGSANLSNRSMGMDTECDLAAVATHASQRRAIARLRARMMAHHLGIGLEEIEAKLRELGSMAAVADAFAAADRRLEVLETDPPDDSTVRAVLELAADPEQPIALSELAGRFASQVDLTVVKKSRPYLALAALLAITIGLGLLWRITPFGEALDAERLAAWLSMLRTHPLALPTTLVAYAVGGLVVFPITIMILATLLVFGSWPGAAYALIGSVAASVAAYLPGRVLGERISDRFEGTRAERVARRLTERGVLAVAVARNIPVAPASVLSFACGAVGVPFGAFVLGSAIGFLPGVAAIALFGRQLGAAVTAPSLPAFATLAAVAVVLGFGLSLLRRWVSSKELADDESADEVSS